MFAAHQLIVVRVGALDAARGARLNWIGWVELLLLQAALDVDGDGSVTFAELLSCIKEHVESQEVATQPTNPQLLDVLRRLQVIGRTLSVPNTLDRRRIQPSMQRPSVIPAFHNQCKCLWRAPRLCISYIEPNMSTIKYSQQPPARSNCGYLKPTTKGMA